MTPQDLRSIIVVADPRHAPDGDSIAFVHRHVGERHRVDASIWCVTGDDPARPLTQGRMDSTPRWRPGGGLAFVRGDEEAPSQVHLLPAGGGESRAISELPEGTIGELRWTPDGSRVLMAFRPRAAHRTRAAAKERTRTGESTPPVIVEDPYYRLDGDGVFEADRYQLMELDPESKTTTTLWSRDTMGDFSFDVSPDGRTVALTTNVDRDALRKPWRSRIVLIDLATGRARTMKGPPDGPKTAIRFSPDGTQLAWAGRASRDGLYSPDNLELWVAAVPSRRSNTMTATSVTASDDHCLMAAIVGDTADASFAPTYHWTPDSKRLFLQIGTEGTQQIGTVAASGRGGITLHTSGPMVLAMGTPSPDGRSIAVVHSDAVHPPELAVAEVGGRSSRASMTVTPRTDFNAAYVATRELAPIAEAWVTAEDGARSQLWVMRPAADTRRGAKPRRRPAILEIHGGPHGQYGVGYMHEFQCLAAAGYTVVFSNPRGSKGYGQDHCAAIRGAWGTADWADIQAVTRFMQDDPHMDAKRLGVMGGSYGGYMTNWTIGHCDDFRAAITDRCVSNLLSMGGTSDIFDAPNDYFPGNFWDDIQPRWDQSPMQFIGNCTTPTLIIHSEGDLRCNVEQSEQLHTALCMLGVETRFVRYPRSTSHGMSRSGPPDLREHRLGEILAWWKRHLATRSPKPAIAKSRRSTRRAAGLGS